VDPAAQPITAGQIPDLRDIPLSQLRRRVANGDAIVRGVVSRITDDREDPSRVPVMAFQSSI
jgi:FXSXX-COOH protein